LVDTFSMKRGTSVMQSKLTLAYLAVTFIGIILVVLAALIPKWYVSNQQNILMAENINSAIDRGIDPMAVRCAYASSGDQICLAYSITHKPIEAPLAPAQAKR
jgi:hypothetical protein